MPRSRVVAGLAAVLLVLVTMQVASGWVGVVTTRGVSMQPTYHQGDLVVTKRSDGYGVGDVIAYRSSELSDEVVLHRIIDTDADAFITQGDNNDWVDRDRPTTTDVVGEAWFHLPGAGRFIAPLRRLGPVVTVGAFLALAYAFSSSSSSSSRPDQPRKRPLVPTDPRNALLHPQSSTWLGGALLAGLLLAAVGFSGPTSVRQPVAQDVAHDGTFTYAADTEPSLVYPDGSVDEGDPVFRSATDVLEVRYRHKVGGLGAASVGSLGGDVVLRIGAWEHELAELEPVALVDGRGEVAAEVDAAEVDALVAQYREISAATGGTAVLLVRPTVEATLGGPATSFDAELELTLGPDEIGIAQDQLAVTGTDSIDVPTLRPRHVELLGRSIAARDARIAGVVGAAASVVLLLAATVLRRRAPASAPIVAAAHGRLVPVRSLDLLEDVIDVLDAEAFAKIAEGTESSLLRSVDGDGNETFVVDDGRARYRFCVRSRSA